MLTRLIESNYFANRDDPTAAQVEFWLRELRTPSLLVEVAESFREQSERISADRPLLALVHGPLEVVAQALQGEELRERDADRRYWAPLRKKLAQLRRQRRQS